MCEKVVNTKKTKEVFQVTGLPPFNTDIFSDEVFLPSQVSNWSQGNWNEDLTGKLIRNYICLCPSRRKQQRAIHLQSFLYKSPLTGSEEMTEGASISPSNIFPLSKAKTAIRRGRSHRKSEENQRQ